MRPVLNINSKDQTDKLKQLAEIAWEVREQSYIVGKTKVGCAVMSEEGDVFAGCNVEHVFRCHDVHAEVNALTSMVSGGAIKLAIIFIAAEREQFTPCGGCLDWIFQFGGDNCLIFSQATRGGAFFEARARELMPFYPK